MKCSNVIDIGEKKPKNLVAGVVLRWAAQHRKCGVSLQKGTVLQSVKGTSEEGGLRGPFKIRGGEGNRVRGWVTKDGPGGFFGSFNAALDGPLS